MTPCPLPWDQGPIAKQIHFGSLSHKDYVKGTHHRALASRPQRKSILINRKASALSFKPYLR
jgi:hypothetical protein